MQKMDTLIQISPLIAFISLFKKPLFSFHPLISLSYLYPTLLSFASFPLLFSYSTLSAFKTQKNGGRSHDTTPLQVRLPHCSRRFTNRTEQQKRKKRTAEWPGVWLNMENRTLLFISTSFNYPIKLLSITCRKQEKKKMSSMFQKPKSR